MQKDSSAPAEEPARLPQLFRLRLDHDDVYFGCEAIPEGEEPKADDVVLDHAPDNPPGRYRWMRAQKRLEPLPKEQQKAEPGAPTLEQAFRDFLDNGAEGSAVAAWKRFFDSTIDGAVK